MTSKNRLTKNYSVKNIEVCETCSAPIKFATEYDTDGYCPQGCFGEPPPPQLSWRTICQGFFSAFDKSEYSGRERKQKKIFLRSIDRYLAGNTLDSSSWKYLLLLDAILSSTDQGSFHNKLQYFDQSLQLRQAIEKAHKLVNYSRNRKNEPLGRIKEIGPDWITPYYLRLKIENGRKNGVIHEAAENAIREIFTFGPLMQHRMDELLDQTTAQLAAGKECVVVICSTETPSQDTETLVLNVNTSELTNSSKEDEYEDSKSTIDSPSIQSNEQLSPEIFLPCINMSSKFHAESDDTVPQDHHLVQDSITEAAGCEVFSQQEFCSSMDAEEKDSANRIASDETDIFADNFSFASKNSFIGPKKRKLNMSNSILFDCSHVPPDSAFVKYLEDGMISTSKKRDFGEFEKNETDCPKKLQRHVQAEESEYPFVSTLGVFPITKDCSSRGKLPFISISAVYKI